MSRVAGRPKGEMVRQIMAPPAEGGGVDRRANPSLRPTVQTAFERLLALLRKAGRTEILEPIAGLERVDDVLRERPAQVPTFMELAWQLRAEPDFAGFFRASGSDRPVSDRNTPIAPCDLTFDQIVRAHLQAAARLSFDRRERDWVRRRARKEQTRRQKRKGSESRGGLSSRLITPLKTMWDGDTDLEELRTLYPGHGLYPVLKPHLREAWQFPLVEIYGRLSTAQARILGHLIAHVRDREMLEMVVGLDVEDLAVVRAACRAFAESYLNLQQDKRMRWELSAEAARARDEAETRISTQESITFDTILLHHRGALDAIRTLGLDVRPVIRRLTPVYGNTIWTVLESPQWVDNAQAVPDHLLKVLGTLGYRVPADISTILGHIRDRDLAHDLLAFAREEFSDDELVRYLADPARKPVWNALPAKFNNAYRYQRDAPAKGSSLHNSESLRLVSTAIFQSLRLGTAETF
ncbi:hypothetical protein [Roseospira navarrensis]|uniref:hypothetical protein n=1 Tax=Roseospira navarrensis TaxID=140058 RepID=UPI001FEAFC51|nr:hypothetical protein [Roseospira navarrensis]